MVETAPSARVSDRWAIGLLPTVLVVAMAVMCVRPMATYRTLSLGGDTVTVGLVAGAFGVLSFAAAIPIGRLIDGHSPRTFMILGAMIILAGAILASVAGSVPLLAASQAILGLGQIVAILGGQSLLAARAPAARRATWFGRYTLAASLGNFLGPTLGSVIVVAAVGGSHAGMLIPDDVTDLAFLFAASLAIVAILIALVIPGESANQVGDRSDVGRPRLANIINVPGMRGSMAASLAILISNDVAIAYLPVYGTFMAMPVSLIGVLLATLTGASVLSRIAIGPILGALGAGAALGLAIWLPAAGLLLFPLANDAWLQFVLIAAAGAGFGIGQPITLLAVASLAPIGGRASALGIRLAGNRFGQMVAPAVAGWISGASAVASTFTTMAVVLAVAGLSVGRARILTTVLGGGDATPERTTVAADE